MKRLISIFVTILMVTTMILPTAVFAEETESAFDPFAGDYVAGELPPNLFKNPKDAMIIAAVNNTTAISKGTTTWTTYWLTAEEDLVASTNPKYQNWNKGLYGTQLLANNPANVSYPANLVGGKSYVFSFVAKNNGTTDSFVYNIVIGSANNWGGNYTVEHGKDGFVVSDKENWNTFGGTFVVPGTGSGTSYITYGFQDAKKGSSIIISYNQSANNPPYLAEEAPYDISFTAKSGNTVIKGVPATFEAKLLNQINSTGYLAQNVFTYSVFGADGNAVEGLTVSADGIVSATDAVADGTYYVRATAAIDEDTTWQKTVAFNVAGALENTDDYVAKSANAIATPSKAENYNGFNTTAVSPVTTTPGIYIWNVISETTAGGGYDGKLAGSLFKTSGGDYVDSNFKVAAGEKLILKMPVKNIGSTDSVRVNASLINSGAWGTANFSEEYGSDGVLVTDKDNWTILTFTLTMPGTPGTEYKPRLVFGFPAGVPAGSGIAINLSTQGVPQAFVGKEEPNDIRVTGASSSVAAGSSLDLEAEVFNSEIDAEFTQSFDWVAVNTDRTNYVDGITFTSSNNGANVKVNVAENVAPGNYLVVAQNKTYGMNRQYPITVTAPSYDVTEFELTTTSATATLEALEVTSDDDVMVIVAAFSGNKMMVAEDTTLTPVEGVAALADPIQLTGLSAGYEVRVFVWDEEYTPFTMKSEWKLPVTIE